MLQHISLQILTHSLFTINHPFEAKTRKMGLRCELDEMMMMMMMTTTGSAFEKRVQLDISSPNMFLNIAL
jgi:hypothetical protein